jgi:hypothetical protein
MALNLEWPPLRHRLLPTRWSALMPDYIVASVIICDDVRKEVTGKDILIGVYGSHILVPSLPVQLPVAIWLEVIPNATGHFQLDARLRIPGSPLEMRIRLMAEVADGSEPLAFSGPPVLCDVGEAGDITVAVKSADQDDWQVVKTKPVRQGPLQAASIPQTLYGPAPDDMAPGPSGPTASEPPSGQFPPVARETKAAPVPPRQPRRRTMRTLVPE